MVVKRIVRYLCLNRNPFRPTSDVIEAWLAVIFAAMLLTEPMIVCYVGYTMYLSQMSRTDAVLDALFPAEPAPTGAGIVLDTADPYLLHLSAMWNGPSPV